MGWDGDGQDCQDGDGPGWTIFARMDRIVGMGMGLDGQDCPDGDGWGCTGLPGWGWAGMDRIVWMGMGLDRQDCLDGVGMRKVGPDCRDGDWQ